ncbi:unnamed protein product [Acanthoscelides obtectus]|uniref:CRAL-TRIO domain-containing protein n=1 Tax=Acanthoscelides obtectus TaxID=200917 RepID=A0A9P0PLT4_ACAOB|nr:unnamed protein product [Acanthoscelides obtectus]CAK1666427.1 Retinol-binding protein pinta [Acanthoscelides obtectus]
MDVIEVPSATQLKQIKKDLGEDEDRMKSLENVLFQWIDSQPHMSNDYDKNVIRYFLRGCKHDMEKAKKHLECHFAARSLYPELFGDRSVSSEETLKALEMAYLAPLSKLRENGNRVSVFKFNEPDAANIDMNAILKTFFMIYDIVFNCPHPVVAEEIIFDYSGCTPGHLMKFLACSTKLIKILRKAYAIRLTSLHLVNAPSTIDRAMTVVKPMLHPKIRERIVLHQSNENLHDHFGDILPSNYGGKSISLEETLAKYKKLLKENSKWLEDTDYMKMNGSIPKDCQDNLYFKESFGVEGSFRKLELD